MSRYFIRFEGEGPASNWQLIDGASLGRADAGYHSFCDTRF